MSASARINLLKYGKRCPNRPEKENAQCKGIQLNDSYCPTKTCSRQDSHTKQRRARSNKKKTAPVIETFVML
jgi:hypothetical protein